MGTKKRKEPPRFRLRAVFVASFPHPWRDGPLEEMTLRYIITVTGEHDEELCESAYFYAKAKMENLGLKPLGIELEEREYFVDDREALDPVPAVRWAESPEATAKAVKARRYVPEDRAEALELYDDATKHPNVIRSARSMLRKEGEGRAPLMVETMAGARFRFVSFDMNIWPRSGNEVRTWLPVLEPINDAANALKAQPSA